MNRVSSKQNGAPRVILAMALCMAFAAPQAVRADPRGSLDLRISVAGDQGPRPVAGTDFRVVSTSDPTLVFMVHTNDRGHARLDLPAGQYEFSSVGGTAWRGRVLSWNVPFEVDPGVERDLLLTDADAVLYTPSVAPTQYAGYPASTAGVWLPEAVRVRIELLDELSSNKSHAGQPIHYQVRDNVYGPRGELLIAAGSPAHGVVTEAKGSGTLGRKGKLEFTIDGARAVDGSEVPLRAEEMRSGSHNIGELAGGVLLFGAVGGFIKGQNVSARPGTVFDAYVDRPISIMPLAGSPAYPPPGR